MSTAPDVTASRGLPRWAEVTLLVLILALAAGFRLYRIGQVPPGPHYDEAANLLDVVDVLHGHPMVFSPRSYGREMLLMYLASPLVALLGPTTLAMRLPTALAGVATILATYLLARELFLRSAPPKTARKSPGVGSPQFVEAPTGLLRAQGAGLLAALFLALSFWNLALNRIGFRANLLPLTETLCFLFLWRAVRTGRQRDFVASGICLGLSFHTYTSARFVPIVLVAFFGALLLTRAGRNLVLPRCRQWLLLVGVALAVASPLLVHFLLHPGDFLLRAQGVSILNPGLNQGHPLGLLLRSVLGNLGLFGVRGDQNWLYNLPGRPGLDAFQAALFWGGLLLCLVRAGRPRVLFLAVWWLVMLLPSIVAPDPIPHTLRAIGTLPVAALLSALALTELALFLWQRVRLSPPTVRLAVPVFMAGLMLVYTGWAGANLWRSYFDRWLPRDEVYYAYYGYLSDLADEINRDTDPQAVYLFPLNYDRLGDSSYQAYPLEVLHRGAVPFRYIVVDDATVAQDLTQDIAGKRRVHLVVWTHGEHVDADPRGVLPTLLTRFGAFVQEQEFRGFRILTYDLPSTAVDFTTPPVLAPVGASFGDELVLLAQAHAETVPSGEQAWMVLRWQAGERVNRDYKVSVRLSDADGHRVGQSDVVLLSNEHRLSTQWVPDREVTSYHLLPSLPATLPGSYRLSLVVYDPETLAPLPVLEGVAASNGDELPLGTLEISRPRRPATTQPQIPLSGVRPAPRLALAGYDLRSTASAVATEELAPGDTVDLALYWHAQRDLGKDYVVSLQLLDSAGALVAEWTQSPAFPTSQWRSGDRWRDWHSLLLPSDLAPGVYDLKVQLTGLGARDGTILTRLQVVSPPLPLGP